LAIIVTISTTQHNTKNVATVTLS